MDVKSPSPDYDFILKDNKPAKRGLAMPNLPKPLLIGLAALVGLILLIIIASILSGRSQSGKQPYIGVLARNQETLRVTQLADQLDLQDPQTQALAATVNSVLSSDQQQIEVYLTNNHIKVSKLELAADTDKSTDDSLQSASQNNSLDATYISYAKNALNRYILDLQAASNNAGPNGKKIFNSSIESSRTLLNSAPIKSS